MPHVECLACKTCLHNTESQRRSARGSMPVRGSLLAPVGNLSEIVRVPRNRVARRHVAPRRIRGGAADRRRGRRDHRLTRAQARASPARNRKLRRSASHPTSPSPQLSRSRQRRRSRETPPSPAGRCRAAATRRPSSELSMRRVIAANGAARRRFALRARRRPSSDVGRFEPRG